MDLVVLDECLPRKLAKLLAPHHTRTVPEIGLAGFKNGTLLRALSGHCRAFITIDSNLSYQQNLPALPFASILLAAPSNRLTDLEPLGSSHHRSSLARGAGSHRPHSVLIQAKKKVLS